MKQLAYSLFLAVPLAGPVGAADLPVVINRTSELPRIETGAPQAPQGQQLPTVINLPSGTDGTKPPPAAGVQIRRLQLVPTINGIDSPGLMTSFAGPTSNYYASTFVSAGYYDFGLWGRPYWAGSPYWWGGANWPWSSNCFYNFGPAVLYRDILTTPLGRTFRLPPGGLAVPNALGYMYNAPVGIIR